MPETEDKRDIEEKEFYLSLVKKIVDEQENMVGEKVAIQKARGTPLQINKEGEITGFYGKGEKVLETLDKKYTEVWGQEVARRKIRRTISDNVEEEKYDELPEQLIPREEQQGPISRFLTKVRS